MAKLVIPENQEELAAGLHDKRLIAQLVSEGQFQEWIDAYVKVSDKRGAETEMIAAALEKALGGKVIVDEKIETTVKNTMELWTREHGVPGRLPESPANGAEVNARFNPAAPGRKMDELAFANIGDFARTVWHKNPRPDERLAKVREVMNDFSSVEPSAGGFLIPETMRSEIMQLALETSFVRPRATVITMQSLTQLMPYVDSTTNVGSVFGGMVFYWTPEAATLTSSQPKFGRMMLQANKLTGWGAVPNELFNDAPALSSWLMQALPRGISFYEDVAFLVGSGVGQPLGVLNSEALVTVTKETGQGASTILTENILNMYSRMLPSSLGNAVWVANQTTFPQLMSLSIAVGTGGAPVALVDIHSGPQMTMLGRPLIITEKVPSLTNAGDISFIDFSYYLIGDRQAVSIETSEHALFQNDETALRTIERCDGRPWLQSAFTPLNGSTVSPFVTLGAR